jgi:peroxiredoxin Q/BCP
MSELVVGSVVPEFSVASTNEKTFVLSENKGKNIVIYFYPRDSTPGCTTEGQNFRDAKAEFDTLNTIIVGVSKDTMRKHENFKAKQSFNFELLSDEDGNVCEIFDVYKLKKLYGKEYMGIERSTFLIDAKGVIQKVWRKVKVKEHVAEVLEATKNLA